MRGGPVAQAAVYCGIEGSGIEARGHAGRFIGLCDP